jgi:hypothetical protein
MTKYAENPGIKIQTWNSSSPGVKAETYGYGSDGVYIETWGTYSNGVEIETQSDNSTGVRIYSSGHNSPAVNAVAYESEAIRADSLWHHAIVASTLTDDAIYAKANPAFYGLNTPNKIRANGVDLPTADIAEYMPAAENVTPGTVMIIGDTGTLQMSTDAYDTRVAGIVSTQPGVTLGKKDAGNPGEEQIAVAGRVPCKVDATKAPIHAGDLLATSDNPGYAMKAEPDIINGHKYYPDGSILGKAMGTLESGTGTIEVLVTLQ